MASTLDGSRELALLLTSETGLGDWLNAAVAINVAAQGLYVAIIEVKIWVIFNSSHKILS